MPNFQITLVSYRDVTVQAKDLETARQWRKNRPGNALFSEPTEWAFNGVFEDYDNKASAEVHADGTHTEVR